MGGPQLDLDSLEILWVMDVKAFIIKSINSPAQEIYIYFSIKYILTITQLLHCNELCFLHRAWKD